MGGGWEEDGGSAKESKASHLSRDWVGTNCVITDDCDDDYFEARSEERFDDFDNEQREVGLAKQTLLKARAVTGAGRREIIKMIYSRTY